MRTGRWNGQLWKAFALVGCIGLAAGCGTSPEFIDDPVAEPQQHVVVQVKSRPAAKTSKKAPLTATRKLIGRWEGVGHQSDGSTWPMEVDITRLDDGVCGVVRYPSLGCGGYWVCDSSSGRRLRATEKITEGRDICVDDVEVSLKLNRSKSSVAFTAKTGNISAAGRLTRASD